jgi:hypothetical protein
MYNLCHQAGNVAMGFGQSSQLSTDAHSTFQQLRNSRVIKLECISPCLAVLLERSDDVLADLLSESHLHPIP